MTDPDPRSLSSDTVTSRPHADDDEGRGRVAPVRVRTLSTASEERPAKPLVRRRDLSSLRPCRRDGTARHRWWTDTPRCAHPYPSRARATSLASTTLLGAKTVVHIAYDLDPETVRPQGEGAAQGVDEGRAGGTAGTTRCAFLLASASIPGR
jgi:hypothetical protein